MGLRADGTVECPAGLSERHEFGSQSFYRCQRRAQGDARAAVGSAAGARTGAGLGSAPPPAAVGVPSTYSAEAQDLEVGVHMLRGADGSFSLITEVGFRRDEGGGMPSKVFTLADGSVVRSEFDDYLDVQELDEESALMLAEAEEAPPVPVVSPRVAEVSSVLEKAKLSVLDHTLVTGLTPNDFPAASVQQIDGKIRLNLRGGKPAKAGAFESKALMALEAQGWYVTGGRRGTTSSEFLLEKR